MNRELLIWFSLVFLAFLSPGCASSHNMALDVRDWSPKDISAITMAVGKHTSQPVERIKIRDREAEAYTGRQGGGDIYLFRRNESGQFEECGSRTWN